MAVGVWVGAVVIGVRRGDGGGLGSGVGVVGGSSRCVPGWISAHSWWVGWGHQGRRLLPCPALSWLGGPSTATLGPAPCRRRSPQLIPQPPTPAPSAPGAGSIVAGLADRWGTHRSTLLCCYLAMTFIQVLEQLRQQVLWG